MKTLYLLVVINIGLILTSCSPVTKQNSLQTPINSASTASNGEVKVALYPAPLLPQRPYQVIRKVKIARIDNSTKPSINWEDKLQQKAAESNADAIINIHKSSHFVSAELISYKKILI